MSDEEGSRWMMELGPGDARALVEVSHDAYRRTDFPLFGLPDTYDGPRMLGDGERMTESWEDEGGTRVSEMQHERFGLAHGNPLSPTDPLLQVITSSLPGPEVLDLLAAEAQRPGSDINPLATQPLAFTIVVDHEPVVFEGVESGSGWAVEAERQDYSLSVVGVRFPRQDLELVRVDVERYVQGRGSVLGWL